MAASRTSIIVRMPRNLKRRLAREVARRESTLNDVAVEALAAAFGVDFTPSGRRGSVPGETLEERLTTPTSRKDTMARNGSQNGKARRNGKVRVAIIGVGNCANSLL